MKRHLATILLVAVFLLGVCLLLYPTVSDYWNSLHQTRAIGAYEDTLAAMTQEDYSGLFAQADDYNAALRTLGYPLTEYKTLAEATQNGETISLVWVRLHTGRFHQIRAQFAARKMPLLGDGRYGSREKACGTALFSCGVGFAAPAGGKEVFVRQTPPRAFPWNAFAEALYDI